MEYSVVFSEEDAIVQVTILSRATEKDHFAAMNEVFKLCREHSCSSILVDLREMNSQAFSTFECFTFGKIFAERSPHFWLAHVLPADSETRNDVKFTSTVEANRGKSTGEFATVEEARQWLLEAR
ncbi:MAG: hypothetical protein KAH31_07540 [Candidatus Sabulitectum sp.]|nr:hypothetical protein [Candidatus Sabulitectum sp.]